MIQKSFKIEVSESASFHDILYAFNHMNILKLNLADTIVIEKKSMMVCDIDVALCSLCAVNGMIFQVY